MTMKFQDEVIGRKKARVQQEDQQSSEPSEEHCEIYCKKMEGEIAHARHYQDQAKPSVLARSDQEYSYDTERVKELAG